MSNGLFDVDGIDLGELVAEHLGPRVLPCELIKPGAPGGRDPANKTKVLPAGAPTKHKFRGFIEDFSDHSLAEGLVLVGDRKVTVLVNTIEGGVPIDPGPQRDCVTVEGKTWSVHRIMKRDPADATYVLQVRDPAKQVP